MSTTIDSLQIEIQSNAASADQSIRSLAGALGELKANGTINVAIKNLNNLRNALKLYNNIPSNASKLSALASSMERLKEVGPLNNIGKSLSNLAESLKSLDTVDISSVAPKIQQIKDAVAPLSSIKAGGLGSMVNALGKIADVTAKLDDDTIEAFADRVRILTERLEPLSAQMTTIQAGLRGINSRAKSAGSSMRQMGSGINIAALNMSNFINIIRSAVQWIQKAIDKFSELISEAIEWDGISQRFGRGFVAQAQENYEWILRLNEELGINVQQFMQYSSTYATMLSGFGVAAEDASKMALGYMELTYDIWAGYNDIYRTLDDAAAAVRSAIAGEVEPVRKAGFTIIESTLEQTAANHGLAVSLENATEAQKSYLRYLTLVDQAYAQGLVGTYAKELSTAEGLMRTFAQQLKSLAQAFGSLFLPILTRVMPYVQAFVEVLEEAIRLAASLFGIEIQAVDWSGINSATNSVGELGSALDDAGSSANKLKNYLLGIDELNIMPAKTDTDASLSLAGGWDGLDVDSLWDESIFDSIQTQVKDIKEKLKAWLGITDDIDSWAEFFDTRLGKILETAGLIAGAFAAWKIGTGIVAAINAISTAFGILKSSAIGTFIVKLIADIKAFFALLAEGNSLGSVLSAAFPKLSAALSKIGAAITGFFTSVSPAVLGGSAAIAVGVPTFIKGLYDALTEGIDWLSGSLIAAGATATGAGIGAIVGSAAGPIGTVVGGLIGLGVGLITDGAIYIKQRGEEIVESAGMAQKDLDTWAGETREKFSGAIDDMVANASEKSPLLGKIFRGFGDSALGAFDHVKLFADNSITNFRNFTSSLHSLFNGDFAGAWENFKTFASDGFSGAWSHAEPFLDKLSGVPAWMDTNVVQPVSGLLSNMGESIAAKVSEGWENTKLAVAPAAQWFAQLFGSIRQTADDTFYNMAVIADGGVQIVEAVWENHAEWVATEVVEPVKNKFNEWLDSWNKLSDAAQQAHKDIKTKYIDPFLKANADLWAIVKEEAAESWSEISSVADEALADLREWSSETWTKFKKDARESWLEVKDVWSDFGEYFGGKLSDAWERIRKAFSKGGQIFVEIKDGVVSGFKRVVNGLINGINDIIKKPFEKINEALLWMKNLEIAGIRPFTRIRTIHVPQIPTFAQGGFPEEGQMFVAREAGPEMVGSIGGRTAVANNEQIVSAIAQGVYQAVVRANAQSGGTAVEAKVNDKVLFEVLLDRARQETMRRGYNPLVGGV